MRNKLRTMLDNFYNSDYNSTKQLCNYGIYKGYIEGLKDSRLITIRTYLRLLKIPSIKIKSFRGLNNEN